jgi:uncharacterized membrane protein
MTHSLTGLIHLLSAFLALGTGAVIFFRPKAGALHRRLGYVYAVSMLTVNLTALLIYRVTGGFNFFHAFALISLTGVALGLRHAITRRPKETWLISHYYWMTWSYAGLMAAFVAESGTRLVLPFLRARGVEFSMGLFWAVVGLLSFAVIFTGRVLINRHSPLKRA